MTAETGHGAGDLGLRVGETRHPHPALEGEAFRIIPAPSSVQDFPSNPTPPGPRPLHVPGFPPTPPARSQDRSWHRETAGSRNSNIPLPASPIAPLHATPSPYDRPAPTMVPIAPTRAYARKAPNPESAAHHETPPHRARRARIPR